MARLWLVRCNPDGVPILPAFRYGPILTTQQVTWRGRTCNDLQKDDHNELWFPNSKNLRNPGWLTHGVRPPIPMPRTMRWSLQPWEDTVGTAPPEIIGREFIIDDLTGYGDNKLRAAYDGFDLTDTVNLRVLLDTDVSSHRTSIAPTGYKSDDFILRANCIWAAGGNQWTLASGPDDYDGGEPLPEVEVPCLAISSPSAAPLVKSRSLVFSVDAGDDEPEVCEDHFLSGFNWTPSQQEPEIRFQYLQNIGYRIVITPENNAFAGTKNTFVNLRVNPEAPQDLFVNYNVIGEIPSFIGLIQITGGMVGGQILQGFTFSQAWNTIGDAVEITYSGSSASGEINVRTIVGNINYTGPTTPWQKCDNHFTWGTDDFLFGGDIQFVTGEQLQ